MIEMRQTELFSAWFGELTDLKARARIAVRLDRLALGNEGDHKSLGEGLSELRIDHGPGYRVYYTRRGDIIYVLLCGGTKRSQGRDIKRAKAMCEDLEL